jgi:hypothetical protein
MRKQSKKLKNNGNEEDGWPNVVASFLGDSGQTTEQYEINGERALNCRLNINVLTCKSEKTAIATDFSFLDIFDPILS